VEDIVTNPAYLDVSIPAKATFEQPIPEGYTAFAYVFEGEGYFEAASKRVIEAENLVIFSEGEMVTISATEDGVRFLLISGAPIGEPVAWRGPIVMNTQGELRAAFDEIAQGTFLKHNAVS
jgi:redox-sensitive bicupin YhaK (pirin superfamily)